jgi:hypothetical protein
VRTACATVISAAIVGALLVLPTPIFAGANASGTVTATGPSGAGAPTGLSGPAGATRPTRCSAKNFRLRCPDLIMSAPSELHLDRSTTPGHVLLRAASSLNNRGNGPLELRAHRTGRQSWAIYQAVYDRGRRRHLFRRPARLVFKHVPGERYGYGDVGAASYWKFEHAAAFELWSVDARFRAVRPMRRGPKVDYCLRDLVRTRPSRRSPSTPAYAACSQDRHIRRDLLGTSSGWSDVYPYEYPQQWIDVTGLRGRFAYVQTADPLDLLIERTHKNNVSETYVALPSGRVLGHRVAVAAP